MMVSVVEAGTATAAQISGIEVAGKTGTAETGRPGKNDTGFIAFAPADAPEIAIAVFLQNQSERAVRRPRPSPRLCWRRSCVRILSLQRDK